MLRAILTGLILCFGIASNATAGTMRICNQSAEPIDYAMIWDEAIPVLKDIWVAEGWKQLAAGDCVLALRSSARQELFLSVRKVKPDGSRQIADYGVKQSPCWLCKTAKFGIEDFFCVAKGAFTRREDDLDDHKVCPAGYHLQLFNLFAFSAVGQPYIIEID